MTESSERQHLHSEPRRFLSEFILQEEGRINGMFFLAAGIILVIGLFIVVGNYVEARAAVDETRTAVRTLESIRNKEVAATESSRQVEPLKQQQSEGTFENRLRITYIEKELDKLADQLYRIEERLHRIESFDVEKILLVLLSVLFAGDKGLSWYRSETLRRAPRGK